MRGQRTTPLPPLAIRRGVLVLSGYGLRVGVQRKHLVVSDGICDERRELHLSKATSGLRRLVILGHTGTVTLDGLRWLHDISASVVQIDADGQVILASGPASHPDGRLRRAQALAPSNGAGLGIVRHLLSEKLNGQANLLSHLAGASDAALYVRRVAGKVDRIRTLQGLRALEADGAGRYWQMWEHIPVQFVRRDQSQVPKHWLTFGTRSSPLTHSPRLAANPAGALANYLYAILETESRIACPAMGLDPSMGLLHVDLAYRDSLVFDVMEAARPRVDAFLLETLRTHVFRRDDFVETRQGACRLAPHLAKRVAETAPGWGQVIGPIVERVAHILAVPTTSSRGPVPTRLTQANRSAGRKTRRHRGPDLTTRPKLMPRACRNCGVLLEDSSRRLYCETCFPERRQEADAVILASGAETLRQLRASGRDPAHGGAAAIARRESLDRSRRLARSWEAKHTGLWDAEHFRKDVLPLLRQITIREMMRGTGLSSGYCSMIRKGVYVPHPRHWKAFQALIHTLGNPITREK